jgi:acetyl esterase/lipase
VSTGPRMFGLGSRRFHLFVVGYVTSLAVVATVLLSGFHWDLRPVAPAQAGGTASEVDTTASIGIRTFTAPGDAVVAEDLVYATEPDGTQLTLDVCSPADAPAPAPTPAPTPTPTPANGDATPGPAAESGTGAPGEPALRPAVISVHGGSWARGDKANSDWRAVCEWLASEGFVAYSVNYRLVPLVTFPAAIDDVGRAVEWVRANSATYDVDPDRIGAFGGSAGGNLASLLGARGSGPLTEGSRVAAVAELSGPVDLSYDGVVVSGASSRLEQITLNYLNCSSLLDCPAAARASAVTSLDKTDPPVFIGASVEDFIPLSQSTRFAAELDTLGITNELVTVPGNLHSIGILDEAMRAQVANFLHLHLGT